MPTGSRRLVTLPTVRDRGHGRIGSRRLVASGLRGFPQFGRVAGPPQGKHRLASAALGPGCKSPLGSANFSDTSSFKSRRAKGSIGHAFTVCIRTENQNQMSFYPFVPHEISVLVELILGHLRYLLTDVPPQPNSPPDNVFHPDRRPASRPPWSKKEGQSPASD